MNSAAFLNYQNYAIDQKNNASLLNNEIIQWAYVLALPIVGLLMLCFFLSLGGLFALLGPWAIFIAARFVTHRWNKKINTIETIETQRELFLKFTF